MLDAGEHVDAAETFAAILEQDPMSGAAFVGLVRSQIAAGETVEAQEMLDNAPADLANDPAVLALKAQLELAEMAGDAGESAELLAKLDTNPDDYQARFDLALALLSSGDPQASVDNLLELFRRDRNWNDEAAKMQLFKIFESLGPEDEIAITGRRQLSSMIFA
jgi:putative thioredoxin